MSRLSCRSLRYNMIPSRCYPKSLASFGLARYPLPFVEGEATLKLLHVERTHDIKIADFVVLKEFQQAVPCSGSIPLSALHEATLRTRFYVTIETCLLLDINTFDKSDIFISKRIHVPPHERFYTRKIYVVLGIATKWETALARRASRNRCHHRRRRHQSQPLPEQQPHLHQNCHLDSRFLLPRSLAETVSTLSQSTPTTSRTIAMNKPFAATIPVLATVTI
jgi:hypothetical protein